MKRLSAISGQVCFLGILICMSVSCAVERGSQQAPGLPSEPLVRVGPTSVPPVIDGKLDDICWRDATMASGFVTIHGVWAYEQTTAYITYDDTYLYVAFECDEPSPEKIKAVSTENDSLDLFAGDTVEMFLDPDHDHQTYYHIGISPNGAHYEAYCSVGGKTEFRESDWNPGLELKTLIGANDGRRLD